MKQDTLLCMLMVRKLPRTICCGNKFLAEEKARQEAGPEAGRLKEEKQRQLRLRQLEEQRRLKEEAEEGGSLLAAEKAGL
ncbi:hypothetical protein DPMN_004609 [Dreissena polymorpha]|uniref:Uncharacterized protein n=1 Tax=Dreissena polymorpha TaxID=45954 RepID=A0A9D4MN45_DREPO|nr:hypothetical protein DPMN_004609 [Dreissena polymorpha]